MSAENESSTTYQRSPIEFKSSSLTVPTLIVASDDINAITLQLKNKVKQAPDFFKYSPLLIDYHDLVERKLDLDLVALVKVLRKLEFNPIGIRGASDDRNKQAGHLKMTILSDHRSRNPYKVPIPEPTNQAPPETEVIKVVIETQLITLPVRSGQRVYSEGDLIITAPVSPGAEVMAEGNIHIYGTLRGRALAGVQGKTDSRIFCSALQAELISIAGNYQISEDIDSPFDDKPVQISLEENALIIHPL